MAREIKTLAEAILEREEYGQLCPETIKKLEKIKSKSWKKCRKRRENNEH